MIPNALVVAFDPRVRFEPAVGGRRPAGRPSVPGMLVIPRLGRRPTTEAGLDRGRPAAAGRHPRSRGRRLPDLRRRLHRRPDGEQREQFILVNSPSRCQRGWSTNCCRRPRPACRALQKRRFPTLLLDRLNLDDDSPLRGHDPNPDGQPRGHQGQLADQDDREQPERRGALPLPRATTASRATRNRCWVLKDFWAAVAEVFADAWGLNAEESRLMHGAGIVSLGFVMDAIADRHRQPGRRRRSCFRRPGAAP